MKIVEILISQFDLIHKAFLFLKTVEYLGNILFLKTEIRNKVYLACRFTYFINKK